ncbi:hypothetical protein [Psychroserpens sp.]|nr:hypothetical protein [Psychroserpens sp.]
MAYALLLGDKLSSNLRIYQLPSDKQLEMTINNTPITYIFK